MTGSRLLLGLAPGGVCLAGLVAQTAGALLPHRFTLACAEAGRSLLQPSAVCFLLHFPSGRPDSPLASTVALWSPDLPQRGIAISRRGHSADSLDLAYLIRYYYYAAAFGAVYGGVGGCSAHSFYFGYWVHQVEIAAYAVAAVQSCYANSA